MAKTSKTSRTVVGLDIEPGQIAAAEVKVNHGIRIERAAAVALPPGLINDGEVVDIEALGDALKSLFAEHKLGKQVRVGMADQRVVVRTLDLPPLKDAKELAAAVRFQAQEHIPMPLEQAVLDFQHVGMVDTPEGERARVVVVAARRESIDRLVAVVRRAGLRLEGIDLSAFAMIRALKRGDASPVLYLNVAGLTNLAIAEGDSCLFTRVVASGLETMVAQLAERRELTLEHARQWLTHVGLEAAIEDIDGDPAVVHEARQVLHDGVRRVADEVRHSLDFFHSQEVGGPTVGRAILTGPTLAIEGFVEEFGTALGLPVEAGTVAEATDGALGGIDAGRMTVAAGLAVEEVTS